NLTGNSSTGARGNNRQIDLRGMGPENTLILIDGKPVTSRNSVRYSRNGERDTRGDTNWVPVEMVDRIEVIRGPAAARYGSGAAGGVVNIITKGIPEKTGGSITLYGNQPQRNDEGETYRANFNAAGPISSQFGLRVYGSYSRTESDDPKINVSNTAAGASTAAGREGVKNQDYRAMLRWQPNEDHNLDLEAGYSRQGNIYAGDTNVGVSAYDPSQATLPGRDAVPAANFLGDETNTMTRQTYSVSHRGKYSFGKSSTYFQYEHTKNRRMGEGGAGSVEGNIQSDEKFTSKLKGYTLNTQLDVPFTLGLKQVLTVGAEWNRQELDDPRSIGIIDSPGALPPGPRDTKSDSSITSAFIEDNIEVTQDLILTPGLRFDHHNEFGNNWSPALNASYMLTPTVTLKAGIARTFKAPNLYQINPNYLYMTSGNGCPLSLGGRDAGPCYVLGNADLDPEISLNKEVGINYTANGWNAGITYFHNKYKSKITSGEIIYGVADPGASSEGLILKWENATDAVLAGFEGNLLIPLAHNLNWSNNFTYMQRNKDKQKKQPLSIVPKYTINSTLDWQVNDKLSLVLTAAFYGKQKPRTNNASTGAVATGNAVKTRPEYDLWGISAGYTFSKYLKGRVGISNLFDKRLFREGSANSAGANTYNEPGRAYYVSITASY
ncbi:MAG: FepA family TonB-dependent siderophore receptor, partial [Azoarcus sp.]|nr:FepA family TonB-dependent siderophore receptor [Azoarcus sp.]